MTNIRIIPRLDIKGPNLVKGIHLEGLRVIGKPERFANYYYENGADELFFQDTVASLYGRNNLKDIISKTAKEIFVPLTVGGGLRSIEDIKNVLRAGADKVSINTSATKNPNFIREAAKEFGSSTIVVAIEVIRGNSDEYLVYTDNGREYTGIKAIDWAIRVSELGAGEIIITSVDKEGTGEGFDIELISKISNATDVPVIAHGGCGNVTDMIKLIENTNINAIAISSMLHYNLLNLQNNLSDNYTSEGNTTFLSSGKSFSKINPISIKEIKTHLHENSIPVRF